MFLFSRCKKKTVSEITILEQLHLFEKKIYDTYGFNEVDVTIRLEAQQGRSVAYCNPDVKPLVIVVGVKEYIEANKIEENEMIHFQNSVLHECIHANTQLLLSNDLKKTFKDNKRSYGYWAFKLLDEYIAYTKSNAKYKQDKQFLRGSEQDILKAVAHYGQRLKAENRLNYFQYADSYYDLGSSFIAHKCVNPDFPSVHEESYLKFISSYFNHLKEASENCLKTYADYECLSKILLDDFRLLIKCVQKLNPHINVTYDNFLTNSHMYSH